MPDLVGQFSAQAIGQGLESRGKHCLNILRSELQISHAFVVAIDSCAQSVRWNETICGPPRRDIDSNRCTLRALIRTLSYGGSRLKYESGTDDSKTELSCDIQKNSLSLWEREKELR